MALSFGTRIKFLLGHIWLSISSKVIRGPSLLVLPSLVSILLPMVFNKSVFAPTRASLGVYTNFKCSDCGKCFTRRATLEHHQQHFPLSLEYLAGQGEWFLNESYAGQKIDKPTSTECQNNRENERLKNFMSLDNPVSDKSLLLVMIRA